MKKTLECVFRQYSYFGYYQGRLAELETQTERRGYTERERKDYRDYIQRLERNRKELKKYDYLKTQEVEE